MQFFAPHQRSGFIDVAVIAILVLVSAVVAVPVTYFANKTTTENRSYATISCGGGTCPDGWSYGADPAAPQTSCAQRAAEACAGHQAKPAATTAPPAATTKPGTCTANGCTYYSCTQKLNTDSCGGRTGPVAGFCATNYPATDPCKINSTPSTAPPTSSTPPTPTTGACPNGQSKACGGCLVNVCVSIVNETCQSQINRLCNTNPTCAGNGVAPAAGQSCCSPYVLYSNGKCGTPTTASCIAVGGSKPVGGTTPCCTGSYDCGTSCADSAAKCPAQPAGSAPVQIPAGSTCTSPSGCICTDTGRTIQNTWTCPSQQSLSPGVSCPNGNITCSCVRTGQTINGGEKCPLLTNGAACSTGAECTSTYCNGICQVAPTPTITPSPLPIAAGKTCTFAYKCVCTDTGRIMQNTWTCPAQLALSSGASCPSGNSVTCTCPGNITINSGEKCQLPLTIAPGAKCSFLFGCKCSDTGNAISNGSSCPAQLTLAAGATCPNGNTTCYCTNGSKTIVGGERCPVPASCPAGKICTCTSATNSSSTQIISATSTLRSCSLVSDTITIKDPPTSCTINGSTVAIGATACESQGAAYETKCLDIGPQKIQCATGQVCFGSKCTQPAVTCSIGGQDVTVGTTTCSSQGALYESKCGSGGVVITTYCTLGQTCQTNGCKPKLLNQNPTATPIPIAGGVQCTGSVIDPGCLCATTGKVIFAPATCEKALLGPAQPTEGSKCSLPHGQYDSTFSMYCCTPSTGAQAVYSKNACAGAQGYYLFGNDLVDGTWCTPGTLGGCARCASKTTYTLNGQTYCGTAPQASNTVIISPGTTCSATTSCVCSDSGRLMQKTWTCPAQIDLSAGATCQAGNNTCICPDKSTIVTGEKCSVTPPVTSTAACSTLTSVTCTSNPTCEWLNSVCQIKGVTSLSLTSCTATCTRDGGCICPQDQGCKSQVVFNKGDNCGGKAANGLCEKTTGCAFYRSPTCLASMVQYKSPLLTLNSTTFQSQAACEASFQTTCLKDGVVVGQGGTCCSRTSYQKGNNVYCGKSPVTATSCTVGGIKMSAGGTACKSNGDTVQYVCVANGNAAGNAPDDTGVNVLQSQTCNSGWTCQGNTCVARNFDKCTLPHGQLDIEANMFCCEGRYLTTACSGAQGYYLGGANLIDGTWCTPGSSNIFTGSGGCGRCEHTATQRTDGKYYCGPAPRVYCNKVCPANSTCLTDTLGGQCKGALPPQLLIDFPVTAPAPKSNVTTGEICQNANGCSCTNSSSLNLIGTRINKFDVCGKAPTPANQKTCTGQCTSNLYGGSCSSAGEQKGFGVCPTNFVCCTQMLSGQGSLTAAESQCIARYNSSGLFSPDDYACQKTLVDKQLLTQSQLNAARPGQVLADMSLKTIISTLDSAASTYERQLIINKAYAEGRLSFTDFLAANAYYSTQVLTNTLTGGQLARTENSIQFSRQQCSKSPDPITCTAHALGALGNSILLTWGMDQILGSPLRDFANSLAKTAGPRLPAVAATEASNTLTFSPSIQGQIQGIKAGNGVVTSGNLSLVVDPASDPLFKKFLEDGIARVHNPLDAYEASRTPLQRAQEYVMDVFSEPRLDPRTAIMTDDVMNDARMALYNSSNGAPTLGTFCQTGTGACLEQSVALDALLEQLGYKSDVVGVALGGPELNHAAVYAIDDLGREVILDPRIGVYGNEAEMDAFYGSTFGGYEYKGFIFDNFAN